MKLILTLIVMGAIAAFILLPIAVGWKIGKGLIKMIGVAAVILALLIALVAFIF